MTPSAAYTLAMVTPVIGVLAAVLFAMSAHDHPGTRAAASAAGVLVAGAATLAGGLLGFLFGIPRSLKMRLEGEAERGSGRTAQRTASGSGTPAQSSTAGTGNEPVAFRGNTNLEQISDWLTKILVGVGLTQLGRLGGALDTIGTSVGPLFGDSAAASTFAAILVLYFVVYGFLTGFLWTRLALGGAFRSADLVAIGRQTRQVASRVEDLEHAFERLQKGQADRDTLALQLPRRFSCVNSGPGSPRNRS